MALERRRFTQPRRHRRPLKPVVTQRHRVPTDVCQHDDAYSTQSYRSSVRPAADSIPSGASVHWNDLIRRHSSSRSVDHDRAADLCHRSVRRRSHVERKAGERSNGGQPSGEGQQSDTEDTKLRQPQVYDPRKYIGRSTVNRADGVAAQRRRG